MAMEQVSEHTWFFKTKLTYKNEGWKKGPSHFQEGNFILINAYLCFQEVSFIPINAYLCPITS